MKYIGIDLSINSTGVFIDNKAFSFPADQLHYTKTKNKTKWFKWIDGVVETVPYEKYIGDCTIEKHKSYKRLVYEIENCLKQYINGDQAFIVMEGYSYSSNVGPLIDLVTLGALLRDVIIKNGWGLKIISPKELKYFAGESTYPKIYTTKSKTKWKYQNNNGITAGRFKKEDILLSILENDTYTNTYIDYIKNNKDVFTVERKNMIGELESKLTTPKPIDDINDAFLLKKYGETYSL